MASKKSSKTTAITDVAHPGKSAPDDTSRSIVISRPIMQDPMVVGGNSAGEKAGASADKSLSGSSDRPVKVNRETTLQPLTAPELPIDDADTKTDTASSPKPTVDAEPTAEVEPVADAQPESSTAKSEPKTKAPQLKPDDPEPAVASNDAEPADDSEAAPAEAAPAENDKAPVVDEVAEAAEQSKHEAELQKIIDSKKYFLSINSVEKRRSARFVALGIVMSVLLAIAWVDVALDAGLIHLGGLKAVTHLFSS